MSSESLTLRACLNNRLLRYVRDEAPTEEQLLAWLGGPKEAGVYHKLRKAGLFVIDNNHLRLAPECLSADGKRFTYDFSVYQLDTDEVWLIRRKKN